jgi:hypothetical protein
VPIILLEDVELLNAAIDIVPGITPEVDRIMLLKIGIDVREVPESLLITKRSHKLRNGN